MRAYLSDDKQWVLVEQNEIDPPEEMPLADFIAIYGRDAVPKREPVRDIDDSVEHYYDVFRVLCKACGEYAWAAKTEVNNADGVYPVQNVVRETFGGNAEAALAGEVARRDRTRRGCVDELDALSRQLGFKPMSDRDKEVLINHLFEPNFRKRMRYRIDKYAKAGMLFSARDLVIEVLKTLR